MIKYAFYRFFRNYWVPQKAIENDVLEHLTGWVDQGIIDIVRISSQHFIIYNKSCENFGFHFDRDVISGLEGVSFTKEAPEKQQAHDGKYIDTWIVKADENASLNRDTAALLKAFETLAG